MSAEENMGLMTLNSYAADIKPMVLVVVALRVDERHVEGQVVSAGSSTMSSSRPPVADAVILKGTRVEVAGAGKAEWEGF